MVYDFSGVFVIYRSLLGDSNNSCYCGNWLEHFRRYGRGSPIRCAVFNCINNAEVGAHIQNIEAIDKSWYIIPMCKPCSLSLLSFGIKDDITKLALANVSLTCGRNRR